MKEDGVRNRIISMILYISTIGKYIPSDKSMFQPDKYATRLDVTVALMEMLGDKVKKQEKGYRL